MNFGITRFKKVAITVGVTSLLALSVAGAGAIDTVTQGITSSGSLTAAVADLPLPAATYSYDVQLSDSAMALTAEDASGTNAGWHVTILASDFAHNSLDANLAIPAENFTLDGSGLVTWVAGQAIDPTDGPLNAATDLASLASAQTVITANAGFGKGEYTQSIGVSLEIPANSVVGTYTSTLITTIDAAP